MIQKAAILCLAFLQAVDAVRNYTIKYSLDDTKQVELTKVQIKEPLEFEREVYKMVSLLEGDSFEFCQNLVSQDGSLELSLFEGDRLVSSYKRDLDSYSNTIDLCNVLSHIDVTLDVTGASIYFPLTNEASQKHLGNVELTPLVHVQDS